MKNKITTYTCPWCDKIIESLSVKQAEFNYSVHRQVCKFRLKKEDEKEELK